MQIFIKYFYFSFVKWLFTTELNLIKYLMEKETEVLTGLTILGNLWELESFGFNSSKINAIVIGRVKISQNDYLVLSSLSEDRACTILGGCFNKL